MGEIKASKLEAVWLMKRRKAFGHSKSSLVDQRGGDLGKDASFAIYRLTFFGG